MKASRKIKSKNIGGNKFQYKSLKHCSTTSHIVECLFSRAKLICRTSKIDVLIPSRIVAISARKPRSIERVCNSGLLR